MKPLLEKVRPPDGASWAWLDRRLDDGIPFQWHHHPEYELTLTLNSRGQRFIGDAIGDYDDGDLVLVGPNQPHTWSSRERIDPAAPHRALVMWFHPDWAASLLGVLAELRDVGDMLRRAQRGLQFSRYASALVRPAIEDLFTRPPDDRLTGLIEILRVLASDAATPLSTARHLPPTAGSRERIDRVLDHIHLHYADGISIPELAGIAALSPSGLHRLFRRHTQQTVSDYVMRLRIGEACALLSATNRPIAHVAADVGYDSLANFNRQFKALKSMTPRAFRQKFEPKRR